MVTLTEARRTFHPRTGESTEWKVYASTRCM